MEVDVVGGVFRDLIFYGDTHSDEFLEMPGGSGYNVFAALRSLNVKVNFHAVVGNDWPFEEFPIVNSKSGVFVSQNETKVLAVYRGANLSACYTPFRSKTLFATLECGGKIFEKYAKEMKRANGRVILDPSPIFEWNDKYIELCDVLLPNEEEYGTIFGRNALPQNLEIYIKLGAKGGVHFKDGKKFHVSVEEGGKFPLGCGDAFDATVVYGLLKRKRPHEILKMAVEMGRNTSLIRGSSSAVLKAIEKLDIRYEKL